MSVTRLITRSVCALLLAATAACAAAYRETAQPSTVDHPDGTPPPCATPAILDSAASPAPPKKGIDLGLWIIGKQLRQRNAHPTCAAGGPFNAPDSAAVARTR